MNFLSLPSPLWVLGTDTSVGKTTVACRIATAWLTAGPVTYRKPFQTGVDSADSLDADQVAVRATGAHVETGLLLREPLSPLAAAEAEGVNVDLDAWASWTARRPADGSRLLLEPAGGVLVPLAPGVTFADWAAPLGIPAVIVARGGLGTLNHALLTCEAWTRRGGRISAVILNPGVDGSGSSAQLNADILCRFLASPVWICRWSTVVP